MTLLRSAALVLRLATVVLASAAAPAAAQSDARLVAAVKLAQEGQADSARAITRALLTRIPASDTLYPQVLFAAASVSATSPDMEKALRRIVVEYPSSEWVDDALLRLAQLDYAGGDVAGAAEKLERLRTDFPNSTLLAPAALWAARSYFELRNRTAACTWLTDGRARAGTDVETGNQLAFYQQRCAPAALMADAPTMDTVKLARGDSVASAPTKTPAPKPGVPKAGTSRPETPASSAAASAPAVATPTKTPARTPPPAGGAFRLQLAAMQTAEQAATLVASLAAKDVTADVTVEGGFHKVRTGRYPTRAAAVAAVASVQLKVGSTPFVVREGT